MTSTSIGVIIPAHNAEPFLRDAIESVLQQSIPLELIVVNDGSTDLAGSVIESYGEIVRGIHQDQRGPGAARNHGIQACRNEWIAFLDADDRWTPDKLSRQAGVLAARSDIDVVFGAQLERVRKRLKAPSILLISHSTAAVDIADEVFALQDGILAPEHTGAGRRDILRAVP
jgi:glycosyltransferase involved in cell wall biosynthesis